MNNAHEDMRRDPLQRLRRQYAAIFCPIGHAAVTQEQVATTVEHARESALERPVLAYRYERAHQLEVSVQWIVALQTDQMLRRARSDFWPEEQPEASAQ